MLTPKVAFHRSVVATVDCAGVVDLYHPLAIATACIGNRIDDSISKIPQVLWECYHKSCGNLPTANPKFTNGSANQISTRSTQQLFIGSLVKFTTLFANAW